MCGLSRFSAFLQKNYNNGGEEGAEGGREGQVQRVRVLTLNKMEVGDVGRLQESLRHSDV